MTQSKDISAESSRPVGVHHLGAKNTFDIVANDDECAALAQRFGVRSFSDLAAQVTLTKLGSDRRIRLEASVSADVVQSCVVTLDPVASHIDDRFSLVFEAGADQEHEAMVTLEGEDPPEPLAEGTIDIGAVVAEHLGLALDAYPRVPDVDFGAIEAMARGDKPGRQPPFSVLSSLRSKQ